MGLFDGGRGGLAGVAVLLHGLWEGGGEVTGDESGGAMALGPMVGGEAVEVDGENGGVESRHALGDEGCDRAGEDVAGAGGGECGVSGVVDVMSVAVADDGVLTLEDEDGVVGLGHGGGGLGA